jgi:hypothetical protein
MTTQQAGKSSGAGVLPVLHRAGYAVGVLLDTGVR